MAVFNVVQKRRRAAIAERKRAVHGDAFTGKLKHKPQNTTISGKRKRKLLKKWRRDQKEAVEKGLITMEDIEMAVADGSGTSSQDANKSPVQFSMKKSLKIRPKRSNKKGKKNKRKSDKPVKEASSSDVMVE
ncbi:uncharacterized protein LOC112509861 [Cynara cardunculus var. scolymus]|uniref:Uncharacterized protein n=1 Tax=Cynara cardunculus var. scolymus TaxID=59895 RepID=A0A103YEB8_CYNCS|nr:uncharacterized protein LOC112509861 [Cynara cardunculus var. scolymus]KVI07534.1 hypothetical protein Ccrd_014078 [Cynara cardunculus var. scolymus]